MPLSGYMKTSDPGRISTVAISGSKERRKKLLPTKYDSQQSRQVMYVRDCATHGSPESMGGLVPVELFYNEQGQWVSAGIAKCCVLCWKIVVRPNDEFPEPQTLPVGNAALKDRDRPTATRGKDKKPRTRAISKETEKAHAAVVEFLEWKGEKGGTTAELVDYTELPRATLNRLLSTMIDDRLVEKNFGLVDGQAKLIYHISQKKEA